MLRKITESTQGKYFRAEDENIFDTAFQNLSEIFTPIMVYKNVRQSIPLTPIFFGIIILLALLHE